MTSNFYRNVNSSRTSNAGADDNGRSLRENIRESRLIQQEQWELPEIQNKFKQVSSVAPTLAILLRSYLITTISLYRM